MMMTDKELKQKCGQRLREARGNQKQYVFANACNYSVQTISNIENGKVKLTPDVAHTIEKLCNVRAEYLLCEDDFKTEEEKLKYDIAYANAEIELNTIHSFSQWFLSVIKKYSTDEQKDPVIIDHKKLKETGVELIEEDLIIVENNILRHNSLKLSSLIFSYLMR